MQITPSSGLAPDEIEKLIMEAETSIEQDKHTKQLINERNRLDSLLKNARRALQEFGRSLSQNQQVQINSVLNEAEEALNSETLLEVTSASNRVEEASNKLTEALMATVS
jgi:molecular chaperone DnaK